MTMNFVHVGSFNLVLLKINYQLNVFSIFCEYLLVSVYKHVVYTYYVGVTFDVSGFIMHNYYLIGIIKIDNKVSRKN